MKITTLNVWKKYWSNKEISKVINKNYWFNDIFSKYLREKGYKNFIEIGGYPGYFAIYFKKYWEYDATLLDYVIDTKLLNGLLKLNKLKNGDLEIIKKDFFKIDTRKKYDVVFSFGFIEHFDQPGPVINKHWDLLNKKGTMIIIYPNFLGLNGLIQSLFDRENLNIHNLKTMDINYIKSVMDNLGIDAEVFYYGGLGVWLERLHKRNIFLKLLILGLGILGKIVKLTGFNSKYTSPHIIIVAKK